MSFVHSASESLLPVSCKTAPICEANGVDAGKARDLCEFVNCPGLVGMRPHRGTHRDVKIAIGLVPKLNATVSDVSVMLGIPSSLIQTVHDCSMTYPRYLMNSHDISNRWVPCGYHVGTMWVPCGTTWCQCQAARSPVPQCRCCAAWNCRGSKVSRLGCHMGMGQNLLNMWFFRDDHQP